LFHTKLLYQTCLEKAKKLKEAKQNVKFFTKKSTLGAFFSFFLPPKFKKNAVEWLSRAAAVSEAKAKPAAERYRCRLSCP